MKFSYIQILYHMLCRKSFYHVFHVLIQNDSQMSSNMYCEQSTFSIVKTKMGITHGPTYSVTRGIGAILLATKISVEAVDHLRYLA